MLATDALRDLATPFATSSGPPVHAAPLTAPALSSIVYRSRAVGTLPAAGLRSLVSLAQARNHGEAITGIVVYDQDRFFQWLEGPTEGIGRVLSSIGRDPRHTDVEVLKDAPTAERLFSGWDMKLAVGRGHGPAQPDVLQPSATLLDALHRDAAGIASSLTALAPLPRPGGANVSTQVEALLASHILPELLLRHAHRSDTGPACGCKDEVLRLVPLLLETEEERAAAMIDGLCGADPFPAARCARLFEAVARSLCDLWTTDDVSDLDIMIALCRLQNGLRRLTAGSWALPKPTALMPSVLVAAQPGEPHVLGTALVSALLEGDGWQVRTVFPRDEAALRAEVATTPFDAVHVSLSPVFRRDHRLPGMAETLAGLRRASANERMALVTGGRIFAERADAGERAGADAACARMNDSASVILRAIRARCRTADDATLNVRDAHVLQPSEAIRPSRRAPMA